MHRGLLAPDMVALQVRLAIQDICTGNVEANIFALYRLDLVRDALHANPGLAKDLAEVILSQVEAQASDLTWASSSGVPGVVQAIAESLDGSVQSEANLAAELSRRIEARNAE